MKASLRVLLERILDYAGMFPPAQLPLEEAIRNYVRYGESPQGWMLGRFLCPVRKLPELLPLSLELFSPANPLRLSVLATNTQDSREWKNSLDQDFALMRSFLSDCRESGVIEAVEIRVSSLPRIRPVEELREVILDTAERIEDLGCRITPWYEFTPGPGLTGELEQMILCLGAANKAGLELGWVYAQAGAWKLRCGGTDPATIPSPSLIAHLLSTCGRAQVGFKATAGLHHPIRHFDPRSQDYLHGFINLFVAAVFAHLSVSQEKTTLLLEDTDPAHFYFDDEGLRWGDTFATTAQVRHLRTEMVTSFGSCSFEEPVAGLKALGWLS